MTTPRKRIKERASHIYQAAQQADDYIMGLCQPKKMTPNEATEFLEMVIERCNSALEALREENE